MKFNWGTGIAVFYSLFVITMVYSVYRSTQFDNSLVSDQYYADDLKYQERFDKLSNAQSLKQDLEIQTAESGSQVELFFPGELGRVHGEIHFFCPSDQGSDFKVNIAPNLNHRQVISTSGLKSGLWRVKVDWSDGKKAYYKEEVIQI
ncbi:FixH family protein [Haliscomenobacter hydrossis]|uniref:FixH family protein n=1 Tax=Haliscomenobacter hydrossis (strain ATCC 27775 / DSM 1100 / LMG 10767 / O) TaxID=760192 RepID=F4KRD0_HALH1|nr:FixH family protein [Haliscomenobacter hydrossis]AEE47920.1 FixH family protein [Haliscomenobacter hydrossis DSM 1100]